MTSNDKTSAKNPTSANPNEEEQLPMEEEQTPSNQKDHDSTKATDPTINPTILFDQLHIKESTPKDDVSAATPLTKTTGESNFHETVLRFTLTTDEENGASLLQNVHTLIIEELLKHTKIVTKIFTNRGKIIKRINVPSWQTSMKHQTHFETHNLLTRNNDTSKFIIAHRIITSATVREIRSIPTISQLLQKNKVYLSKTNWDESIVDTYQVAFLVGFNHRHISDLGARVILEGLVNTAELPKHQIVKTRISTIRAKRQIRTLAYAIEVKKDDRRAFFKSIVDVPTNNAFHIIPAKLRYKNPTEFNSIVKQQASMNNHTWVIPIRNITTEMMFFLSPHLKKAPGVIAISTRHYPKGTGNWNISVLDSKFHQCRKHINQVLIDWESHVSEHLIAINPFEDPPTIKGKSTNYESDSDNSQSTSSVQSTISFWSAFSHDSEYEKQQQHKPDEIVPPTNIVATTESQDYRPQSSLAISDVTSPQSQSETIQRLITEREKDQQELGMLKTELGNLRKQNEEILLFLKGSANTFENQTESPTASDKRSLNNSPLQSRKLANRQNTPQRASTQGSTTHF